MKLKRPQTSSKPRLPKILRRSRRRHDPMLVLNMALFNFTDGWNRAFRGSSTRASPPNDSMQAMQSARVEMNAAQQCVIVKAPVDRVYEQWSRIEELPKFITPLRDVRRIDDARFSYSWYPNGQDEQGIFHIILRIPGRRIAWRTMSNGFMSGVVSSSHVPNKKRK